MPNDLRECPFCGGVPQVRLGSDCAYLQCGGCGARGSRQATVGQARGAWNCRAKSDALDRIARRHRELLMRLVDVCDRMDGERIGCEPVEEEQYQRIMVEAHSLLDA